MHHVIMDFYSSCILQELLMVCWRLFLISGMIRNLYHFTEYFNGLEHLCASNDYVADSTVRVELGKYAEHRRDVFQVDIYAIWWSRSNSTNSIGNTTLARRAFSKIAPFSKRQSQLFRTVLPIWSSY